MNRRSRALLYCWLSIWISLSGGIYAASLDIIESPSDACVCEGQLVQFDCTVSITTGVGFTGIADQRWKINLTSSMVIEVSSNEPEDISYSIIRNVDGRPIGLMFSANNIHNLASFTCIGFEPNLPGLTPLSTNAATLEVADLDDISCNVSCPSLFSSDNSSCTVSWTKPLNASCDALFGYTVIITGNGMSTKSPLLDIDTITYITGRLEAFQSYTASVTATSTCGSTQPINVAFMTSREQRPHQFDLSLLFTSFDVINISLSTTLMQTAPRVAEYTVLVRDASGLTVLTPPPYPGDSALLSLDIGSLPPCENYTVSVTARNTALENTSASVLLSLDPLTSLEVSCVAREDGCYLEASCVPSQPGRVSGCRLDYTSSAGSASRNVTQFNTNVMVTAVLCDNQTFSYTGTAYDAMLRPLECIRNSTTKCPLLKDCTTQSVTNGTVQYSTEPTASGDFANGTVANYSCADGYELMGEQNRTCLVDGTWTGAEPICTAIPPPVPSPASTTGLPGWAVAIIVIIILVVVALVVALVAFLLWRRVLRGKYSFSKAETSRSSKVMSQDDLEMDDKADYEVVGPGKAQGQAKAQPPAPQKNPDGLVYADVGTFHERPRRIPPPPKEPEGVQYSAVMFLKEKSPEAVKPLPADDLLTLDNLLRQLSTVVHAWYIIGEHLGLASVLLEQIKEAGLAAPDAMVEVVDNWLRGHKGQPLWREVVAVLEQAGFTQLAADINRVYETNQLPVPPDDGRIELPMVEEDEAPPPPPRGQDVDECVEFAPMVPPKSLDLMQSLPPPKPIRRKEESEPAPSWGASVTQSMPPARPPKPRPRH